MTEAGDDKKAARPTGEGALLRFVAPAHDGDALRQRAEAELVRAAQAIEAIAARGAPSPDIAAMLERAQALHARARVAAANRADYVMFDCLQQLERELVLAAGDDERRVLVESTAARLRSGGAPTQRAIVDALMVRGDDAPTVATCRALLRERHALEQERRLRVALARQQLPRLAMLLVVAVVFFTAWALAGGFEWIVSPDVEITLAMLFTNAVLLGFFGSLLSIAFGLVLRPSRSSEADLAASGAVLVTRAFIGAALAVPIVLTFESGLLNLGEYSPAVPLAVSFVAGFAERLFVRRLERAVP